MPFSGQLSFATYNGETPDQLRRAEARVGAEIRDRRTLRKDPASVLVTNVTMLEYLLLRGQDRPILEQSKGRLRWIVLDEAHSYVGAQAAEMALLLRPVRQAFEVAPEDVRLVATSATIGTGEDNREALRRFVADLAGISLDRVDVIEGLAELAPLPPLSSDHPVDVTTLPHDPADPWQAIAPHPKFRDLRENMRDKGLSLTAASVLLGQPGVPLTPEKTMVAIEAAALACDPISGGRFAPWRMHAFHRAQPGLWACVDPGCADRDLEFRADETDWPFGRLHLEQREACSCGAPVFENVACDECSTPWLRATRVLDGLNERLVLEADGDDEDDYAFEQELDDDVTATVTDRVVLIGPSGARCRPDRWVRLVDGAVFSDRPEGEAVVVQMVDEHITRGCCVRSSEASVGVRPRWFGAPFLMGSAMPLLLEGVQIEDLSSTMPSGGRRLLSFTDSRQGKARFSAKLQQDAERSLTRAVIYHSVQAVGKGNPDLAAALSLEVPALETVAATEPVLMALLDTKRGELAAAEGGAGGAVRWSEMVTRLASHPELTRFAGAVWAGRPKGGDTLAAEPVALARMFLYREFFRRPRMQNNAETMGLARLVFPELQAQARLSLPATLAEAGHGSQVWDDLLHGAVDTVFRTNLAVDLSVEPVDIRHWISPRSRTKSVLPPETAPRCL